MFDSYERCLREGTYSFILGCGQFLIYFRRTRLMPGMSTQYCENLLLLYLLTLHLDSCQD